MLQRRHLLLSGLGAGLVAGPGTALRAQPLEPPLVTYPRHLPQQDSQIRYFVELLRLALARSGTSYQLQPTRSEMVQSRALLEMTGEAPAIDVFWTMTDRQREASLLPVRIPIERGLIGWRLALVRRVDRERFSHVRDLADLAQHTAGQMHDWPDTEILRANRLPVFASTHYQGLFQMLARGRFDYFPRSIFEIDAELAAYPDLELAIDPHLLLHYPAALYLFVRPGRPRLAADLARGMEALTSDGTLERLAQQQFGALMRRHRLDQRRVITLKNPLLPPETPLARKALWFQPPH